MTKSFLKFLASLDIYGKSVSFNFNREDDVVKSAVGGTFTIFFKAISLGYLIKQLIVMFEFGNTSIENIEMTTGLEEAEHPRFGDLNMLPFLIVKRIRNGNSTRYEDLLQNINPVLETKGLSKKRNP
jgi:hypothetical protein